MRKRVFRTAFLFPFMVGCFAGVNESTPEATTHVVVHYEPGRFGGWPANSGVWIWGNEILVGFMKGYYKPQEDEHSLDKTINWLDAYASTDGGRTWNLLKRISYTDLGLRNGNPPSLVRLKDRRLVVTYGFRGVPYGIRAKISSDNGRSWGPEIILRDDARTWDMGYPRSVVRPDGKVVTIYYYSTAEKPEQHIEATIWEVGSS